MIDATECLLLYDVNSPKNLDIPYWSYERFDLDLMTDDECKTEFRFNKNDIRNFESSRQNLLLQWRERGQSRGILHLSEELCLPLQVCGFDTKIRET